MANIENLAVKLTPFDLFNHSPSGPMGPIVRSGGLVFPYSPSISENISVNYESSGKITHSNEEYNVYINTSNRQINLNSIIFTADTVDNAQYMLAAIHFFRSYSLMDFGAGKTGRPPSPMWLSAYGQHAYDNVPVLMQSVDFTIDAQNNDMVGIPTGTNNRLESNSSLIAEQIMDGAPRRIFVDDQSKLQIAAKNNLSMSSGDYTWVPTKLEVGGVSLVVQHTPSYWKNFDLEGFKAGSLVISRETGGTAPTAAPQTGPAPAPLPNTRHDIETVPIDDVTET